MIINIIILPTNLNNSFSSNLVISVHSYSKNMHITTKTFMKVNVAYCSCALGPWFSHHSQYFLLLILFHTFKTIIYIDPIMYHIHLIKHSSGPIKYMWQLMHLWSSPRCWGGPYTVHLFFMIVSACLCTEGITASKSTFKTVIAAHILHPYQITRNAIKSNILIILIIINIFQKFLGRLNPMYIKIAHDIIPNGYIIISSSSFMFIFSYHLKNNKGQFYPYNKFISARFRSA